MISLSMVSFLTSKSEIEQITEEELNLTADSLLRSLNNFLEKTPVDVQVWSNLDAIQSIYKNDTPESVNTVSNILASIRDSYGIFDLILITDNQGNTIAASSKDTIGEVNVFDRDYFEPTIQGNQVISKVLKSKATGMPIVAVTAPMIIENEIKGIILASTEIEYFMKQNIIPIKIGNGVNAYENPDAEAKEKAGYAYMTDPTALLLAHPTPEHIMELNLSIYDFGKEMVEMKNGLIHYVFEGVPKTVAFRSSNINGWIVAVTADDKNVYAGVRKIGIISIILTILAIILTSWIIYLLIRMIIEAIKKSVFFAETISQGNLSEDMDKNYLDRDDEIGDLSRAQMKMVEKLREIISTVMAGSQQVSLASDELATSNQNLSSRTERQAAALEETSSAIEQMNATIRSNTDNTTQATQLSSEALDKTSIGTRSVNQMVDSINDIDTSSRRIGDIIEVINNISFQTNLLALNASIEAARAGEHGKGFAVVAVEVRKLARRSEKAASEITEIIKESNDKVSDGVKVASETREYLSAIQDSVQRMSNLINEIALASSEQLASVDEIDKALSSLDENTQQNAAMVEEAAASTEELSAQAQELKSNVSYFILNQQDLIEG